MTFDEWKRAKDQAAASQAQQERDNRSAQFNQEDASYGPEVDPRLDKLAGLAESNANEFRQNMPQIAQARANQAGEGIRRNLAENMAGARSGYSSRGLLYSGLARNAEAGAQANAAGQMLNTRSQINNDVEDQSNALDQGAWGVRDTQRQLLQGRKDALYNRRVGMIDQRMQGDQQRSAGLGSVLGGAGSLVGLGAGALAKKPNGAV